jgi:secreted PhoX family phosphatase
MPLTRRNFAKRSAITGAGIALAGTVDVLATAPGALAADAPTAASAGAADTARHSGAFGYGELVADPDGVLALPKGFAYRIITRTGVTTLESGESTPSNHDGTATSRACAARPCQQPRTGRRPRRLAAPGAARRGPRLRPGSGRRRHRRRGRPAR